MAKSDQNTPQEDDAPLKGFNLFAEGDPWQLNACLNYSHTQETAYIEGYRQAAELLTKAAANQEGLIA